MNCPYCNAEVKEDPKATNGMVPTEGDGCEFCNPSSMAGYAWNEEHDGKRREGDYR